MESRQRPKIGRSGGMLFTRYRGRANSSPDPLLGSDNKQIPRCPACWRQLYRSTTVRLLGDHLCAVSGFLFARFARFFSLSHGQGSYDEQRPGASTQAAALDYVCRCGLERAKRSCRLLRVVDSSYKKGSMQRFIHTWLKAAKEQLVGPKRQTAVWTAYTAKGKIVVIQGDRVIKVIDPGKPQQQPPHARKYWPGMHDGQS